MPNLPKMVLTSVASSYENLHAYFGVFHPLMLLEQWEDICKCVLEHKNGPLKDYNALAHPQGKDEEHEGLTRVLFTVGVTNRREDALNISDLVLLKYTRKDEKKIVDESARQLFGLRPEYVAPGGNAYGQKHNGAPHCSNDTFPPYNSVRLCDSINLIAWWA